MKKKGFTLIELLAVIVVLAVIALIAVPIVMNTIENAKEGALKSSVRNIIEIAESEYMRLEVEGESTDTIDLTTLEYKGKRYTSENGNLSFDEDGKASIAIYENNKCVYKTVAETDVVLDKTLTKEECLKKVVGAPKVDYVDKSGANKPELTDKLIPVIYDGSNWKVADITQKWYDYDNQEWANAVIFENGVTKNVGDTLNVSTEVAQMYVWIPRYEYQIPEASKGTTGTPNAIDIKFISNTKTTPDSGYNLHPGFKFGEKEVNGLWVGKFETTGKALAQWPYFVCTNETCDQKVTIKPNQQSASGTVSALFYAARSIESQYGLTGVDTHMAKYTEWSTVSYLSNSIYGRCSSKTSCTEISINRSGTYYTGGNNYISNTNQSTTGNITGVYDMSGGAYEYVMGVLLDSSGNPRSGGTSSSNSGFTGMLGNGSNYSGLPFPERKYYDTFTTNSISSDKYSALTAVNGVTGDFRGIFKELMTSYTTYTNWYGDEAYFVSADYPWFELGGEFGHDANTGAFSSGYAEGSNFSGFASRVVLITEK